MQLSNADPFPQIKCPTLLIHREVVERNIRRIWTKTQAQGIGFRPHMKTHQHPDVGEWMREMGIHQITVSSIDMAASHAKMGWNDITIAIPMNPREINRIVELAEKTHLAVLVDHPHAVQVLAESGAQVSVWIELDTGTGRTGIPVNQIDPILSILERIDQSPGLICRGFLWHDGHQYGQDDHDVIRTNWVRSVARASALRDQLGKSNRNLQLSAGDTPSATVVDDLRGVDEVRPGNLVYFDLMQWLNGICQLEEIGICLAAPVIGHYPGRNEIAVHAGAVHLSKEVLQMPDGQCIFGKPVRLKPGGWEALTSASVVQRISQEHGIIRLSEKEMESFPVGSLIGILPVHACLTADAMMLQAHHVI